MLDPNYTRLFHTKFLFWFATASVQIGIRDAVKYTAAFANEQIPA